MEQEIMAIHHGLINHKDAIESMQKQIDQLYNQHKCEIESMQKQIAELECDKLKMSQAITAACKQFEKLAESYKNA